MVIEGLVGKFKKKIEIYYKIISVVIDYKMLENVLK